MLICYLALYVVNLAWALFVLDPQVLGGYLRSSFGYGDMFVLAWFVASAATVGGGLGSGFDSDEAIRAAAYSKREEERRERLARNGTWTGTRADRAGTETCDLLGPVTVSSSAGQRRRVSDGISPKSGPVAGREPALVQETHAQRHRLHGRLGRVGLAESGMGTSQSNHPEVGHWRHAQLALETCLEGSHAEVELSGQAHVSTARRVAPR